MLGLAGDISVIGEAASGDELLQLDDVAGADLLLLDISMPGTSGAELIGILKSRYPRLPIHPQHAPRCTGGAWRPACRCQRLHHRDSDPKGWLPPCARLYPVATSQCRPGRTDRISDRNRQCRRQIAAGRTVGTGKGGIDLHHTWRVDQ